MGDKSEKRDILAEILSGAQEDVVEGLDSLYEIIRLESESIEPLKSEDNVQEEVSKPDSNKPKKKSSHYLTESVFDELGEAKVNLRELLPGVAKSDLTKSNIVDIAVKAILDEYRKKGSKSALIKKLLSKERKTKKSS
ncbi:MAG: hypothetical protein H8E79_01220 [Desulfobulbaceae bacterium]|uniref:Uncharacterized protein n=1 Tax=Candidatus Desulfatifera sulfidica TaxID=2841691 RepID=A0A8J6TBC7_9BACT|nr:hypothetical protein [Candidatus Desulfatifera sulfidica]